MEQDKNLIDELKTLSEQLESEKTYYRGYWEDTAKYFLPDKAGVFFNTENYVRNEIFELYDSHCISCLDNFANILNGTLTNKASIWFRLVAEDEELASNDNVINYLQDTTKKIWNEIYNPDSNFEIAHFENLRFFACFGNIAIKIEESKNSILNFEPLHIKNYVIAENEEGKIDTCVITQSMTAKQIISKFGEDNVHENIKKEFKTNKFKKLEVKYFIFPQKDRDTSKIDRENMPYVGYWLDANNDYLMQKDFFESYPIAFGRGTKNVGETWGTSRALLALPDAKTLNKMVHDHMLASEKSLTPPFIQFVDFKNQIDLSPGSLNRIDSNTYTGEALKPLLSNVDYRPVLELILDKKESIKKIFFLDKLTVLDDPRATATQILELRAESFRIMGSLAISLQEYLENILNRVFQILWKRSYSNINFELNENAILNELPIEFNQQLPKIKVEYINPITQSQKNNENNAIDAFILNVMNLAQVNSEIIDKINFDKLIDIKTNLLQIDNRILRKDKDVEEIRNEKRQNAQQQIESERNNIDADTLKKLNK